MEPMCRLFCALILLVGLMRLAAQEVHASAWQQSEKVEEKKVTDLFSLLDIHNRCWLTEAAQMGHIRPDLRRPSTEIESYLLRRSRSALSKSSTQEYRGASNQQLRCVEAPDRYNRGTGWWSQLHRHG